MDVPYLLASLLGVGLLVGLNVFLMRGRRASLDATILSQCLGAEVPGFRPGASQIAGNGAALCENAADGSIYLAVVRGDAIVTRKLSRGIRLQRNGATLTFVFSDFTFPRALVAFGDERVAAEWGARIARAIG